MKGQVNTRFNPMSLVVRVKSAQPSKVFLKVYDADDPSRVFTNRHKTIRQYEDFYVRMPISPKKAIVEVTDQYEQANGKPSGNIKVDFVRPVDLDVRNDAADLDNYQTRTFIEFSQKFSFNAGQLEANKTYRSHNGEFLIQYLPVIKNNSGSEMATPARISKTTGIIQVSKKKFKEYTVPMRMAILLHEYSHFYLNENMSSEIEADLNALLIYLSLGYPRIEAYQAFLEVFKDAPSQANAKRYDILNKFIIDFEKRGRNGR